MKTMVFAENRFAVCREQREGEGDELQHEEDDEQVFSPIPTSSASGVAIMMSVSTPSM
jgi:hypothetical protein